MKIYTKKGDSGTTSLAGGARVSKAHPRVMAYGDLDELISYLGVLRCSCEVPMIRDIQVHLMNISAIFASERELARVKPLATEPLDILEKEIDKMTADMPPQDSFILPSAPLESAECHVARTICRRCERSAVLIEDKTPQDEAALKYINRLSDYLFTLARYLCIKAGCNEDKWLL